MDYLDVHEENSSFVSSMGPKTAAHHTYVTSFDTSEEGAGYIAETRQGLERITML